MEQKKLINFLGIGAAKAGTTWLFHNLGKLSSFSLPPIKEMHYFSRNKIYKSPKLFTGRSLFSRIIDWEYLKLAIYLMKISWEQSKYIDVIFYFKWYFSRRYDDRWYFSLFNLYSKIKGEITPAYAILKVDDIKKIYDLTPDTKIIFMLRNPIFRSWSEFRHLNKEDSLVDTVKKAIDFGESEHQLLRSDYMHTVSNYSKVFPKGSMLLCFYDAIEDDPEKLLEEVVSFLGGDAKEIKENLSCQELRTVVHKSIELKFPPKVYNLLKKIYHDPIREMANRYGGYFNKWYEDTYGKSSQNRNKKLSPTIII